MLFAASPGFGHCIYHVRHASRDVPKGSNLPSSTSPLSVTLSLQIAEKKPSAEPPLPRLRPPPLPPQRLPTFPSSASTMLQPTCRSCYWREESTAEGIGKVRTNHCYYTNHSKHNWMVLSAITHNPQLCLATYWLALLTAPFILLTSPSANMDAA